MTQIDGCEVKEVVSESRAYDAGHSPTSDAPRTHDSPSLEGTEFDGIQAQGEYIIVELVGRSKESPISLALPEEGGLDEFAVLQIVSVGSQVPIDVKVGDRIVQNGPKMIFCPTNGRRFFTGTAEGVVATLPMPAEVHPYEKFDVESLRQKAQAQQHGGASQIIVPKPGQPVPMPRRMS